MMSGKAMNARAMKIISVGFSRGLCGPEKMVCMEDVPGTHATYKRMLGTAATSNMFARPSKHIQWGSLGGSHLNQLLTSIIAKCPTCEPLLAMPMGEKVIDKERLFADDPLLKEACECGLKWTVIPHTIGSAFPLFADMVQKALNTEHNIGQGEDWAQVMYQLAVATGEHQSVNKATGIIKVDWNKVIKQVEQSMPHNADDIQWGVVIGQ